MFPSYNTNKETIMGDGASSGQWVAATHPNEVEKARRRRKNSMEFWET